MILVSQIIVWEESFSLTLNNVYYIPTFNINLTSTTKFIDSYLCHLTLHKHFQKVIGSANRHGDLYVLHAHANSYLYFYSLYLL